MGSSPAVVGNCVFVGSDDGRLYCLDALTGAKIWSSTMTNEKLALSMISSPSVVDGRVFIGSLPNVYCFNASTGDQIWCFPTAGRWVLSSPAVADSRVYVGSEEGEIYCLDAFTGGKIWNCTATTDLEPPPSGHGPTTPPIQKHDFIYVLTAATLAIVSGMALLVYFKKRKRETM